MQLHCITCGICVAMLHLLWDVMEAANARPCNAHLGLGEMSFEVSLLRCSRECFSQSLFFGCACHRLQGCALQCDSLCTYPDAYRGATKKAAVSTCWCLRCCTKAVARRSGASLLSAVATLCKSLLSRRWAGEPEHNERWQSQSCLASLMVSTFRQCCAACYAPRWRASSAMTPPLQH